MNRSRLFRRFVWIAGLIVVPAADVPAGDGSPSIRTSGAAVSGVTWDADAAALPGGVSADWWSQAQASVRQSHGPKHDVASRPRARPRWTAEGDQAHAWFGYSVGTAGDVNGDGYDDVIVGAPNYDDGENDEGRVFVFRGSASGPSTKPDWTAGGDQDGASFGMSVGTAGDVNGDGYDDVVVGAFDYDNGQEDEGRAFAYQGSASGLSITPDWTAESNQGGAVFGLSMGTAGDVNGDGYDDVIGGASLYDHGETDEGVAVVFRGRATVARPQ